MLLFIYNLKLKTDICLFLFKNKILMTNERRITMKKFFSLILIAGLMSGCAMTMAPVTGYLYTDVKAPFAVTSNQVSTKVGTAKMQSILGWVASGDASIEAAAKSAGITKIHHVDYEATSILGIIASFTIVVYGE